MPIAPNGIISLKTIDKYFQACERHLMSMRNRKPVDLSIKWEKQFPAVAGVYVAFENGRIVYVGETDNLQCRMGSLRDSRNHTLRRSVGDRHFSKLKGYTKATTRQKFPDDIEERLERLLRTTFEVAILPLAIGRKEFEDWLRAKPHKLYNRPRRKGAE